MACEIGIVRSTIPKKNNDCSQSNISFNPFWKILRVGNLAWDFFRVNFWSRDFLGLCWKL